MKRRTQFSLIAITCVGVLCPTAANADNPFDKLIPRGTLLKKLKQEIAEEFGGEKAKAPTPALRPADRPTAGDGARGPRPANARNSKNLRRQPTLATRPLPPMTDTKKRNALDRPVAVSSKTLAPQGFGVVIQATKNDDLIVTRVSPHGNGAQAGLRPGDIVKTVGGVDLTSVEEYRHITKGLGGGDQMEFEVVRRGRPEKALVTYGTLPMTSDSGAKPAPVNELRVASNSIVKDAPSVLDGSTSQRVRVSRLPQSARSVVAAKTETELRLAKTIESQRAKMERMELELEMLRRTTTPAIEPIENNWALPQGERAN